MMKKEKKGLQNNVVSFEAARQKRDEHGLVEAAMKAAELILEDGAFIDIYNNALEEKIKEEEEYGEGQED
jgi:hypothetical protein